MQTSDIRFKCPKCGCKHLTKRSIVAIERGVVYNTSDKEVWHDERIYKELYEIESEHYQCEKCDFKPPCDDWDSLEVWLASVDMLRQKKQKILC